MRGGEPCAHRRQPAAHRALSGGGHAVRLSVSGIAAAGVFRQISRDNAIGRYGLSTASVRLILTERDFWETGYRDGTLVCINPTQPARRLHHYPRPVQRCRARYVQHFRHVSPTVMRGYIRAAAKEAFTSAVLWGASGSLGCRGDVPCSQPACRTPVMEPPHRSGCSRWTPLIWSCQGGVALPNTAWPAAASTRRWIGRMPVPSRYR